MDELIERVRARAVDPATRFDAIARWNKGESDPRPLPAPATTADVEQAEKELGFALPPLLRRLHLEVADGCFGPGYSIFGIRTPGRFDRYAFTHDLLVERYRDMCRRVITLDGEPAWPFGMLLISELGCGGFSCIDCTQPASPVFVFGLDQEGMGDSIDPDVVDAADQEELEKLILAARARARAAPAGTRLFGFSPQAPSLTDWLEGWLAGRDLTEGIVW